MLNDIIDPRFGWPISEENLYKTVSDKYGGNKNIFSINSAKNKAGYEVETFFVLTEDSTHEKPTRILFENNDIDSINTPIPYQDSIEISDFVSNFEVEEKINENNRLIRILKQEFVQEILLSYKELLAQT